MPNQHDQHQFWSLLSRKLSGEATQEELQELQAILLNHPDLHHQADLIIDMWQQKSYSNNAETEAAYMRHIIKHKEEFFTEHTSENINDPEPITESKTAIKFFSKKFLLAFSAITILVSVTIYVLTSKKNADPQQHAISSVVTKNGNRTKIVLPDGSQVWLNAGSNLDYNNLSFNKELREVSLNGEAYFDVTKNAAKPFIIHTEKMDVRVVGTIFNIRSYKDEKTAEASLIKGSIEVTLKDRKGQKIVLKQNEKITVANEEETQLSFKKDDAAPLRNNLSPAPEIVIKELKQNPISNIIPEIAWTQNKLSIEDKSLEEIALILEKWYGEPVMIQNESLKKSRYTGTFENATIEKVLSYFKISKPFNFKIENDTVVIY